jgi:hypothetical protein
MDYSKKSKFFLFTFFPLVTTQQTRTLAEVCKKKKDPDEENFFSESDDALFRLPSNDKKKRKIGVAIRPKRMEEEVKA